MINNLKAKRKEARFYLKDIAVAMGVSVTTIGNWEAGRPKPNLNALEKLSEFYLKHGYDWTLDDFFILGTPEHAKVG